MLHGEGRTREKERKRVVRSKELHTHTHQTEEEKTTPITWKTATNLKHTQTWTWKAGWTCKSPSVLLVVERRTVKGWCERPVEGQREGEGEWAGGILNETLCVCQMRAHCAQIGFRHSEQTQGNRRCEYHRATASAVCCVCLSLFIRIVSGFRCAAVCAEPNGIH